MKVLVRVTYGCLILCSAQGVAQNKSAYTLFNPTPRSEMREMSTDRPDKTESPYTVDAGHFQIETDIVNFAYDKEEDDSGVNTRVKSQSIMASNIKAGLTNNSDLQVIITPYQKETVSVDGTEDDEASGLGATIVRYKYNFIGNDGGEMAIAAMPFIKIPTNEKDLGNKRVEGGLILPIGLSLPEDWGLGLMLQVNRSQNEADDEFHTEFISSITTSHDIVGGLGGYLEFYSESSDEKDAQWVATADVGLTYGIGADLQLDAGMNFGLTRAADDLNPFLGVSARF